VRAETILPDREILRRGAYDVVKDHAQRKSAVSWTMVVVDSDQGVPQTTDNQYFFVGDNWPEPYLKFRDSPPSDLVVKKSTGTLTVKGYQPRHPHGVVEVRSTNNGAALNLKNLPWTHLLGDTQKHVEIF
jgi:hypothetical protein